MDMKDLVSEYCYCGPLNRESGSGVKESSCFLWIVDMCKWCSHRYGLPNQESMA